MSPSHCNADGFWWLATTVLAGTITDLVNGDFDVVTEYFWEHCINQSVAVGGHLCPDGR